MFGWLRRNSAKNTIESAQEARDKADKIRERQLSRQLKDARHIAQYIITRQRNNGGRSATIWHRTFQSPEVYEPVVKELREQGYTVEVEILGSVSIMDTISYVPYITITW